MGKWRQALIHQLNGPHLNEEENNPIFHLDAVSIYSDQFRQFFHQIYQIIQRLLFLKVLFWQEWFIEKYVCTLKNIFLTNCQQADAENIPSSFWQFWSNLLEIYVH